MKIITGSFLLLFLLGCGGGEERKEEQAQAPAMKEEAPQPAETPAEHGAPPAEKPPEPEAKPATKPAAPPPIERGATVTGDIIDIVSYATSGVVPSSPSGLEIIAASAKGGNPLGVLQKGTTTVYLVTMKQANTSANSALLPFLGTTVTLKGDIFRKGGQQILVLTTVGKAMK